MSSENKKLKILSYVAFFMVLEILLLFTSIANSSGMICAKPICNTW